VAASSRELLSRKGKRRSRKVEQLVEDSMDIDELFDEDQ